MVIIDDNNGGGFADMGVVMHGLCTGGEVVQAAGTDEAKLVVCSLQMVNHCSLCHTRGRRTGHLIITGPWWNGCP